MKDLYSEVRVRQTITPGARTDGTVDGATVDRASSGEYYGDALVVVSTGTITDGTHTVEVQESDDDSDWTAVADEDLQGTEPAIASTDDDTIFEIGYLGLARYLRVSITTASSTTGGVFGADVVLGGGRNRAPDRS